jgi:glycosyltransferase involved in cell wall biosynthesis
MRVLHLSTSDIRGGAARGAFWLHRALRDKGVDSRMLVGRKYSDDSDVDVLAGSLAPATERVRGVLDQLPLRRYAKTDDSFWTVGWLPRNVSRAVAARRPDLVHVHWTGGGFLPVDTLSHLDCPVVWTMRDMWAFTGGCHYTAGCARYADGCGCCPQLKSERPGDLSNLMWQRKHDAWRNIDLWLVPISGWLADCARSSGIFGDAPIHVIPNGVDSNRFRPMPRDEARAEMGFLPDKRYILFGALGALEDKRKGFGQFVDAISQVGRFLERSDDVELVVFGASPSDALERVGIASRFVGHIDDDELLAVLYSASDVMVAPSLQEAFGKTLVEAMACGTPVVAFDSGGPAEIVLHKRTGYLAKPFEPEDLARGIAWCLQNGRRDDVGHAARARAAGEYGTGLVADRYLDHYRRILTRNS